MTGNPSDPVGQGTGDCGDAGSNREKDSEKDDLLREASVESSDDTSARDLLVALVDTPSVSGNEGECARRLRAFFERHDREVWIDGVGNVRAPNRDELLLTSHIDTVPGEVPVKTETVPPGVAPYGGTQTRDSDAEHVLWGRGSVDAKGALVAMAVVAVRTGASFVGVVGEEADSRGACQLVSDRETSPDAVVNGEPSGWDAITLGYRGLLSGTYVATSTSTHSSCPETNALEDAMDWWSRVESEFDTDESTPIFERVTCKPIWFDGGLGDDGLSVEATMDIQLRIPPSLTVTEVRERAESHLDVGEVRWQDEFEPVTVSQRTAIGRAFRTAIRRVGGHPRTLHKTGTSDMNVFAQAWNCPIVTYGPGNSALDHAPDERLALSEFDRSVAVLEEVAITLLNQ